MFHHVRTRSLLGPPRTLILQRLEQPIPEFGAFEPLPLADKAPVEQLAPSAEVGGESPEAAIVQTVGKRARGAPRQVARAVHRQRQRGFGVGAAQPASVGVDQCEHLVAVVQLAEQRLDRLGLAGALRGTFTERRPRELEHVAQALGGDAHVVESLGVTLWVERVQLIEARGHDAARVVPERALRIETLDLARLHDTTAWPASARRRPSRPISRARSISASTTSLPRVWRARSSAMSPFTPVRSPCPRAVFSVSSRPI